MVSFKGYLAYFHPASQGEKQVHPTKVHSIPVQADIEMDTRWPNVVPEEHEMIRSEQRGSALRWHVDTLR